MTRSTLLVLGFAMAVAGCGEEDRAAPVADDDAALHRDDPVVRAARQRIEHGRRIFRHDTFGSEAFWGDTLRLHEAVAGIDPVTALTVLGLKVDVDALPRKLVRALARGDVDLTDPAVTLRLLELDAVVGVAGTFDGDGQLSAVGIRCALCHSTVDDSLAPGIGHRLDGWPNRDLDVGSIIAAAPDLSTVAELLGVSQDALRAVLRGWGPGRFDAHVILDGKATRPDGGNASVVIPAAFGLAGVNLATYNGWGGVPYWNALVANLEMHGMGRFYDPRLEEDAERFPVAAAAGFADVAAPDDRITSKLAALHLYQLALEPPAPPADSYDRAAAGRGAALFVGKADCARCHVPPLYTEPGHNLHTPDELGIDSFQADRGPTGRYRTTPLGGLFTRQRGGFYHDGRFATLADVVDHYDALGALGLTTDEKADLVQYLLSI